MNRFLWAAAAFAGVAMAVFGLVPKLMTLRFRLTLRKFYRRLERVEKGLAGGDREALLAELGEVDRQSAQLRVPRGHEAPYFEMRQNVHDLTDRATR